MLQTDNYGLYPLCDVALYQPLLGQPGQGRATYIYGHAREGMFLPLLLASQDNNGKRMLGMTAEVYTSDNWHFVYTISEVRRHTLNLDDAIATRTERAGEHPPGPVGAVRRWRQAEDQHPGVGRAESRNRSAPIGVIAEFGLELAGNEFAPGDQPRAGAAIGHQQVQLGHGPGAGGNRRRLSHEPAVAVQRRFPAIQPTIQRSVSCLKHE